MHESLRGPPSGGVPRTAEAARARRLVRRAVRCATRQAWSNGAPAARPAAPAPRGGFVQETPVREALRPACAAARAGGVRVGELLILLKTAWAQVPASRRRMRPDDHAMLARVVTICIEEFYAPEAAADRQGGGLEP